MHLRPNEPALSRSGYLQAKAEQEAGGKDELNDLVKAGVVVKVQKTSCLGKAYFMYFFPTVRLTEPTFL